MEKLSVTHLTEDAPEYRQKKAELSAKQAGSYAYEEKTVESVKELIETWEYIHKKPITDQERESLLATKTELPSKLKNLLDLYEHDKCQPFIDAFLQNALDNELCREKVAALLQISIEDISPEIVIEGLRNKKIDTVAFIELLEANALEFHKKHKEALIALEAYKKEFFEKVSLAIETGGLPISIEKVRSRLNAQNIFLFQRVGEDYLGAHMSGGDIEIDVNMSPEEMKHTLFHELTHHLAGKSIVKYEKGKKKAVFAEKKGVTFSSILGRKKQTHFFFEWLDEAITEDITLQLLGTDASKKINSYVPERAALQKLVELGVPMELFRKAYFEDYNSEGDPGNRLPAWRMLSQKINEVLKDKEMTIRNIVR